MGLNEVALGIPVPDFWAQNMVRVIGMQTHSCCQCLHTQLVADEQTYGRTFPLALPALMPMKPVVPVNACISVRAFLALHSIAPQPDSGHVFSRRGQGGPPAAVCQAGQPAGGTAAGFGGSCGARTAAAAGSGGRHEAGLLACCRCQGMDVDQRSLLPSPS
jgi:hypothetical protein